MAEREPGFYWVRCEGSSWEDHARDKWIIAVWDGHFWGVPFDYQSYRDPQFAEIGERAPPKHIWEDALRLLGKANRLLATSMRLQGHLLTLLKGLQTQYAAGVMPSPELIAEIDDLVKLGERITPMAALSELMEKWYG